MSAPSSRMLVLLSLLQSRRDWPGQELADRLGVTTRTVRRDVDRLRELGYSVESAKGPDGGYRLAAGSDLPSLLFDDEQAVAIAVALGSAASTGVDLDDAAARALATVQQVMPSRLRHRIDGIRFEDTHARRRVDPSVLETVSTAVRDRRGLRFAYGSDVDRRTRQAEPHAIVARGGRWYLVAWDRDKADWRLFRLDRLTPKVPGGGPFAPRPVPGGDAQAFVAARSKGSQDSDRWPCVGELIVELPAEEVAPWLGDGEVEPVTAGTSRVRVGSWSWVGLVAWALRFDAPFTVVGPEELSAAARRMSARLDEAVPRGPAA